MSERYNDTTLNLAELTGCFECKQCGAVVRDIVAHDEWHNNSYTMANDVEMLMDRWREGLT